MKIAPLAEVKAQFSSYVKSTEEGPVVVTRNGKPVAVMLGITDEDELERLILAYSPNFRRLLGEAANRIQENRGIAHEDFWAEVEAETAA